MRVSEFYGDDAKGNHKDNRNESFESIFPDGNTVHGNKNTDVDTDEKVKICVSFENSIFEIDAV